MISSANRKKELFTITANINAIENEREKDLMSAVTFPRIYSHYEKFMWEAFVYLIDTIYEKSLKLEDLNPRIQFLFFTFNSYGKNRTKIMEKCVSINSENSLEFLDKKDIIKEIKNSKTYHRELGKLLNVFSLDCHEKINMLVGLSNALKSKYDSRCDIAHGEEDIEAIKFKDWQVIKEKVIKIFDLVTEIFGDYILNESYRNKKITAD